MTTIICPICNESYEVSLDESLIQYAENIPGPLCQKRMSTEELISWLNKYNVSTRALYVGV